MDLCSHLPVLDLDLLWLGNSPGGLVFIFSVFQSGDENVALKVIRDYHQEVNFINHRSALEEDKLSQ